MLLKYQEKSKISREKMHPHNFRHFYAKHLIDIGTGLDVLKDILGHENINTTAIYTKGSKKEIERIINNSFIA